jgi:hypothetical protein
MHRIGGVHGSPPRSLAIDAGDPNRHHESFTHQRVQGDVHLDEFRLLQMWYLAPAILERT